MSDSLLLGIQEHIQNYITMPKLKVPYNQQLQCPNEAKWVDYAPFSAVNQDLG